jgi:hypothetical protein
VSNLLIIEPFPAPEIKIAYTEIGAIGYMEGFLKDGKKLLLYVIKNAWHFYN